MGIGIGAALLTVLGVFLVLSAWMACCAGMNTVSDWGMTIVLCLSGFGILLLAVVIIAVQKLNSIATALRS